MKIVRLDTQGVALGYVILAFQAEKGQDDS
jgi:hypothetical protein